MKLKNVGLNTLIYTFYFFGSCVVTMLAEALVMYILDKFVLLPYVVLTILRVIIYTVGVSALIGFLGYKEGFREADAAVGETILAGALTTLVPHLIFSMLFHFQGFVSGGVRYAAALLQSGMDVTPDSVLPTRKAYALFLIVYIVYGLVYTGVLTICRYFGAQRRIIRRAELRGNEV